MNQPATLRKLLQRVHRDEEGAVSLETILIIGAIAIPVLIFILKVGWPRIRTFFTGLVVLTAARANFIPIRG